MTSDIDDAVLAAVRDKPGSTVIELIDVTGLDRWALQKSLWRLMGKAAVTRTKSKEKAVRGAWPFIYFCVGRQQFEYQVAGFDCPLTIFAYSQAEADEKFAEFTSKRRSRRRHPFAMPIEPSRQGRHYKGIDDV